MADHVTTVRSIYEAFGRGDVATIIDAMADDVDWEAGRTDHGVPWLRPGRGKQRVAEFFADLGALDIKRFEPTVLFGSGDQVMALISIELLVTATGQSVADDAEGHLWTFGPDGKVVAFRHYVDTLEHHRAWSG